MLIASMPFSAQLQTNESKPEYIRITSKHNLCCVCCVFFFSGSVAQVLQKAQVRIINYDICNDLMKGQLTSRMLCAGVLSGGVDACQVIKTR